MLGTSTSVRYPSIAQQQPFASNIETTHNAIRQDSTVMPPLEQVPSLVGPNTSIQRTISPKGEPQLSVYKSKNPVGETHLSIQRSSTPITQAHFLLQRNNNPLPQPQLSVQRSINATVQPQLSVQRSVKPTTAQSQFAMQVSKPQIIQPQPQFPKKVTPVVNHIMHNPVSNSQIGVVRGILRRHIQKPPVLISKAQSQRSQNPVIKSKHLQFNQQNMQQVHEYRVQHYKNSASQNCCKCKLF